MSKVLTLKFFDIYGFSSFQAINTLQFLFHICLVSFVLTFFVKLEFLCSDTIYSMFTTLEIWIIKYLLRECRNSEKYCSKNCNLTSNPTVKCYRIGHHTFFSPARMAYVFSSNWHEKPSKVAKKARKAKPHSQEIRCFLANVSVGTCANIRSATLQKPGLECSTATSFSLAILARNSVQKVAIWMLTFSYGLKV